MASRLPRGVPHLQHFGATSVFYQGILDDIEKHDFGVFSRRASLSALGKVAKLPALWMKVRSL